MIKVDAVVLLLVLGLGGCEEDLFGRVDVRATWQERVPGKEAGVGSMAMVDSSMVVAGVAVKVYENFGNRSWVETDELVPPEVVSSFGAVAMAHISSGTLWCAVTGRQGNGEDAVFLYATKDYGNFGNGGSGWFFVEKINASSSYPRTRRTPTESFGYSLAASGDGSTLVIGAPVILNTEPGSVYVYSVNSRGNVGYRHQLFGDTPGFGSAVAVKETNVIIVSDPFHDGNKGAVWIYSGITFWTFALNQALASSWYRPRLKWCDSYFGTSIALGQRSPYLAIGCGKPNYSTTGTPILNGTVVVLRTHDNGESFGFHQELTTKAPWFGSEISFTGSSDDKLLITSDDGISLFERRHDQSYARTQDLDGSSQMAVGDFQFVVADSLNLDAYAFETCDDFLITDDVFDWLNTIPTTNVTYTLTAWNEYSNGWGFFPDRIIEVPDNNYLCLRDGCYRLDVLNTTFVRIYYGAVRRSYQFLGGTGGDVQFQFRVNDGWIRYTGASCSDSDEPAPTSFPTMIATPAPASSKKKKNNGLSDGGVAGVVIAVLLITIFLGVLVTRARRTSTTQRIVDDDVIPVPPTTQVEMK